MKHLNLYHLWLECIRRARCPAVQDQLIPRSLVEISQTIALNVELKVSNDRLSQTSIGPYTARGPFVQNPKRANATE
jgi:hypothetical protein